MGIVDEDIERVRAATDMVGLVSRYLAVKRVGRRFVGLCPFHGEKSPSFSVNNELGFYKCFGCGVSGDAITFVREIEHLDFVGAVELLANKANIPLRYTNKGQDGDRKRKTRLLELMGAAVDFYHDRLLNSSDAAPARSYLRERGFTGDEVRKYKVGWAPDDWDLLAKAIKAPGKDMDDAGLAFTNKRNKLQDVFRARVLFPIFDQQGEPVGFGGRIMPGADGPKYKNSSDGLLYSKSRLLYGLNWAKTGIVEQDEVVICEGYTDVIGCARAGVERAVATCGTALTEEHVRMLRRFAKRIVLAFDADAAGQAASERIYEWEQAHDLDVAVAVMPAGSDPGELSISDPETLKTAIENAMPFLGFRVNRVLEAGSLDTPESRAKVADAALEVIREHPNEIVRREYAAEVAVRCSLPVAQIVDLSQPGKGRPRGQTDKRGGRNDNRRGPEPEQTRTVRPQPEAQVDGTELEVLRHSIFNLDVVKTLSHEELFGDAIARQAYAAMVETGEFHLAIEVCESAAADLLERLAMEEPGSDPIEAALMLVRKAARRMRADLTEEMRRDPGRFAEISEQATWLDRMIKGMSLDVQDVKVQTTSAQQLVSWLTESE